jgi:glycosyltransferase involved in cell wall biosynthesis
MTPRVSIVVLNWNSPHVIDVCLRSLTVTDGIPYEIVVVDNGSTEPGTLEALRQHRAEGRITTLVENPLNSLFSQGNNIGVAASDPSSEYVLLLNSDVAFLRPDWLVKLVGWAEGTTDYWPTVWAFHPTVPDPGPRDIVSAGWSHDANVEGRVRPEGWCCLFRRSVWRDLSPDFPWHYGFELAVAESVRAGAKCGVLFNYAPYMIHMEGGSGKEHAGTFVNVGAPDLPGWYAGIRIESLDFTLGAFEHQSYLGW